MRILVTGGAGFIGSALIRHLIRDTEHSVVNLDKLTYAASPDALSDIDSGKRYIFEQADIADRAAVTRILGEHRPDAIVNLAAETHVDRSIDAPAPFLQTNVVGTVTLLEAATAYWRALVPSKQMKFRLLHVSTDEVFGALGHDGVFTEASPYRPSSPYAASKASSDHFVRAWYATYGFPALISNCGNNYGPFQFPEKLIPLVIIKALAGQSIPVYGDGSNVRDWIFVDDHARALVSIVEHGRLGETYAIGGAEERTNLEVVERICDVLDASAGRLPSGPRRQLIEFVTDRPGHDFRYAIDSAKLRRELGWRPTESFKTGLTRTVEWYIANRPWWEGLQARRYGGERLGLSVGPAGTR
jgi:dTDP-glucose 4,6-dehydratase